MISEEIQEKLISIYFRKSYFGFGEVQEDENEFIENNTIMVKVTEKKSKNGYGHDQNLITQHLELEKWYVLKDMSVSQSSSTLRIEGFDNINFNTVNFEYMIV